MKTTPLHLAAYDGHQSSIRILIEKGANINDQDEDGNTALHLATLHKHKEAMILLIEKGADQTITNNEGKLFIDVITDEDMEPVVKE